MNKTNTINYNNAVKDISYLNNLDSELNLIINYSSNMDYVNFVAKVNQALESLYFVKNHVIKNKTLLNLIDEIRNFMGSYYRFDWKPANILKDAKEVGEKCKDFLRELENDQKTQV